MKSTTTLAPSIYRTVLFLFILFLLFNRAYSQLTDAEKAKKEARGTVVKLQTAQTALGPLAIKSSSVTVKLNGVEDELSVVNEKIRIHNLNQVRYDPDKPKTPEVIAYEINAGKLNDSKSEITGRKTTLKTQLENIKTQKDSMNFEIRTLKALIKHKSIAALIFFSDTRCGQMPGEVSIVGEWKSYLDCLFDGTPRNRPDHVDPNNPGDITVIPNSDPEAAQQKQRELKKMLEDGDKNKKPKQPIVVPSPSDNNSEEKGGSLSDALKSLIYQVRNKVQSVLPKLMQ